MPHWKPSCFLINDASQKLRALQLVLYLVPTLYIFPWMFFCIFHKNFDYLKKILDYFKWILCYIDPIHSWWFYCICFPIRVVWGMDKLPIFLCCWPLLKAWFVCGIKKIKDVEVRGAVLRDFHDVMYISINHGKTIDDFKERGSIAMRENLHKHRPNDVWTNHFWTYYHQFGKW